MLKKEFIISVLETFLSCPKKVFTKENLEVILPEVTEKEFIDFLLSGLYGKKAKELIPLLQDYKLTLPEKEELSPYGKILHQLLKKHSLRKDAENSLKDLIIWESDSDPRSEFVVLYFNSWRFSIEVENLLREKAKVIVQKLGIKV